MDGQAAWHAGQLFALWAPGRKIAVNEPRHGARQGREVGIVAAPGLLMMPREVAAIEEARHFEQAEIALATEFGEFRGLHRRSAGFGFSRASHGTIMAAFSLFAGPSLRFPLSPSPKSAATTHEPRSGRSPRLQRHPEVAPLPTDEWEDPCRTANVTSPSASK
jgi:hypothetical protein